MSPGERAPLKARLATSDGRSIVLNVKPRSYPPSTRLHSQTRGTPASDRAYRFLEGGLYETAVEEILASTLTTEERRGGGYGGTGPGYDAEHNPDIQYARDLLETLSSGILPNGQVASTEPIDGTIIHSEWNKGKHPNVFPFAGPGTRATKSPNNFFMDQFGSKTNRAPLLLAQRTLNEAKGSVFNLKAKIRSQERMDTILADAINSGTGEAVLLKPIGQTISVFRYLHEPAVLQRVQENRAALRAATQRISAVVPELSRLHGMHLEFDNNWYQETTRQAYNWVLAQIDQITMVYHLAEQDGKVIGNAQEVKDALRSFWNDLAYIRPPPDI